jgi:hypothetical protein
MIIGETMMDVMTLENEAGLLDTDLEFDPNARPTGRFQAGSSDAHCNSMAVQTRLNQFYLRELAPPQQFLQVPATQEYPAIFALEDEWNNHEEACLDLRELPQTAQEFARWYSRLHREHRHAVAPFFEFLANDASLEQLSFYISMEEQVDGRFDDVIALSQMGMTGDMKLALAENYWDEMGLGQQEEMHTVLFGQSAAWLRQHLGGMDVASLVPAAALKNGNLLLMYALRRSYAPRLLGALAILEHTAPYRFAKTVKGLRRHQVPESVIYYHDMHIGIDANHGKQLFNRVLLPLADSSVEAIREICIGCLIRYKVAQDYYDSIKTVMDQALLAPATPV